MTEDGLLLGIRRLFQSAVSLIMNIVIVGPFGLRPKSTVRRRALPIGKALAARGHRVTVIVPSWDWPEDSGREWQEGGVQVRCLPIGYAVPGFSSVALLARLLRATLDAQPDVVHCFKPKAYSGLVAFLLWYGRCVGLWHGRLVVDTDDWEGPGGWNERGRYSWTQRQFFSWQERWGLLHTDAVTVASRGLQTLVWALGVSPECVYHLPNGVPSWSITREKGPVVRRCYGLDDNPVVLCYTRFVGCGPTRWAEIVAEVAVQTPLARFLVVGAGLAGEESEFWDSIQVQGLAERMTLTGWVPEEDLPSYFTASDLALFPLDDTLVNRTRCPAKLSDLLAAGVPVLVEAVGEAQTYIKDDISGVLLPPGSHPFTWGTKAAALLRDRVRRGRLSRAAREHMEKSFAWGHLIEELLTLYSK